VTIAGFVVGATYDFGSLGNAPPTTASPKFTLAVVSEGYNSSGTLGTINRTLYGTHVVRVPYSTATIVGTFTTGTFVDGETVTQATSGATAIIVGGQAAGPKLRVKAVTGTPNTSNIWTGGTSAATFTPTATPVTLAANTPDEFYDGTNLIVRVALSESVYLDDNTGAGKSGTAPTVTISAAWATNTGGASETSAVVSAGSVTNNSTLVYPIVIAQWAWGHTPAWRAVTDATSMGCIAYHGHGIACVALSATDQHSNVVSGTATSKTSHTMSASGLAYESYDLSVPITSFTAGDDVTLKFIAYPLVGDAASIIDTSTDTTSTDDILGLTLIKFRVNPTTTTSIYVAATDHPTTPGNDSTGNGSSATPYATIGKALSVVTDAAGKVSIIYAKSGGTTLGILGSTPASTAATGCFIEIMPNPGDSVTLDRGATYIAYKGTKVRYSGFTITGNNWLDGGNVASAKLWFDNCTFSPATVNGTVGIGYRTEGTFFNNCTWTTKDNLDDFSARVGYSYTGCSLQVGSTMGAQSTIIATKSVGSGADTVRIKDKASSTAPLTHNIIYAHSFYAKATTSAAGIIRIGENNAKTGYAVIGNIIEAISGSQMCLWVSADSSTLQLDNAIVAHNTVIGERCNLFYNETGTAANTRFNIFCRNNAFRSFNIKADLFGTADGRRTGNWAMENGVNFSDNRYDGTVDPTYTCDYDSINIAFVTGKNTTYGQLGYTTDASLDGTAAGNGNYIPAAGSVLIGHTLQKAYLTYDMLGAALVSDIGALKSAASGRIFSLAGEKGGLAGYNGGLA
jgi:hypothetical protein